MSDYIAMLSEQQIQAPLLQPPPGGFPVTQQYAISDAKVTYQLPRTAGILDWIRKNQTAVVLTAGALFILALTKKR